MPQEHQTTEVVVASYNTYATLGRASSGGGGGGWGTNGGRKAARGCDPQCTGVEAILQAESRQGNATRHMLMSSSGV